MPRLPRASWLAGGAILAALLVPGGTFEVPLPPLTLAAGIGSVTLAAWLVHARRPAAGALALGLGTVAVRASLWALITAAGPHAPLPEGLGEWQATVLDVSSPSGTEQRAMLEIAAIEGGTDAWTVYAWLPRHPPLVPGDHVRVDGRTAPPPADAPGFAGFLASRDAAGTLKAGTFELVAGGSGLGSAVEHLRRGLDGLLARAVPEPEAGLAAGILIGLRERVSRAVADDFTTTGLTHVVAISGWNIALVAAIATALLRGAGLGRRPRSVIVVAAILVYTILAGAEASVIRAALMGGVVIAARERGHPSGAAAALGLACWGLLLADPGMIDDIGLQLSLAATAGLLALGGPAEALVRRATRGRGPGWLSESLGVSLAAQLATLPLILVHFGRLSLISPLANLLVAPVVPLAMLGAAMGVLLGPLVGAVPGVLLAPLLMLCWLPLAVMTRLADLLAGVPLASVELLPPWDLAGAALALLILLTALRARARAAAERAAVDRATAAVGSRPAPGGRRRPARLVALVTGSVLVVSVTLVLVAQPVPALRLSVLDVGQGDAILLEASDGQRLLVDGGPDPDLLVRRLDERIPAWDRRIDLVVLTHPHEDHAGGLAGLVPRYSVGRIAETGIPSDGAGVRGMREMARRHGIGRVRLAQGDGLGIGSAQVSVLWPARSAIPDALPTTGRGINDTSIVLAVGLGRQRALLTGDVEDDRDRDLLAALPRDGGRWDLLKVSHHGSATASSAPLLAAVRPRLAVISSGTGNPYGHPAPSLLGRLDEVGAQVRRTDQHGTVSVAFDGTPRSAGSLLHGARVAATCAAFTQRRHSPTGMRHLVGGVGLVRGSDPPPSARARLGDPCYARPDGRPDTSRSARLAHVHLTVRAAAAAHDGRGRGRLVPGLSRRPQWCGRGPTPGGGCRAPPRRGQGPATRPSAAGSPAR